MARVVLPREAFASGQMIFKSGDPPRYAYLLQAGTVEVVLEDGTVVSKLEAGAIFGEMALIEDSPRSAGVRATDAVNCILITRQEFEGRLEKSDPFVRSMLKLLAQRLRVTNKK